MAIKTIRVFAEYTSDGYVPMPSQGNIDYGITVGSSFPETQPSSFQTDDPNIDVAVNTMTDFYVWIRTHGSPWNPSYTRVVRVYPDSPSINSVVMNMIVAVGSGGTTISSGGGVNYYLNGGTSQGVLDGSTYYEMSKTPVEGTGVDFFKINTTGFQNIAQFVTDAGDPGLLNIPAGNWPIGFYFSASDNSGSPKFYAEVYKYSAAGVFTLLGSGSTNPEVISNGMAIDYYTTNVAVPDTTLVVTDRIAVRIFVNTDGNRTVNLHTQDSHLSTVGTTFTRGLTAINGLIKQVQFIAIGNAGSDAAIVSSDDTHTINLPTASATKRGLLNSTDWSTFNAKQAALSGTGFVKIDGSTISYDNSTYQPLDGDLTAIGALAGTTGILKKTGANTWELDTTTYLSTGVAASTYQRLDKMVSNLLASDTEYPNSNAVLAKLALKANAENPEFTGYMTVGGAYPKIYLTDSDNNPDYFIGNDDGYFRIYDQTNTVSRFYITSLGVSTFPGSVIVGSVAKSGGLSTEFLKADGTVDSNTYVTSGSLSNYLLSATAASTYQRLDKMVSNLLASDTEYPNSNAVLAKLALKADSASPTFTGNMTISSASPKLYLTDTDNNPDYFIGNDDGYFRIYDQTAGASRFYITSLGVSTFPGDVIVGSIAKSGGTASQFLKADGSVDSNTYVSSTSLASYLLITDAVSTYQRKDKMVSNLLASDTEYPNSNAVLAKLALKADAADPVFTGNMTISGATPKLYFVDTDNNPDYTVFADSGYFYIYDQTAGATRFSINSSGNISSGTGKSITAGSFVKESGTSSQFLKADGTVDSSTYLTSYTETDTLATVTARGASTTASITVNNSSNFYGFTTINGGGITTPQGAFFASAYPVTADRYYAQFSGNWASAGTWALGVRGSADNSIYLAKNNSGVLDLATAVNLYIGSGLALHTSNYSTYALPKTGGSLTGNLTFSTQGSKIIFGDSTSASPSMIGEGLVDTEGTDSDFLTIYFRNSLRFFSQLSEVGRFTNTGLRVYGSIVKDGGTSTQFLKADGSVDSNTYALSSTLGNYLPLAGGTMSGVLYGNGGGDFFIYTYGRTGLPNAGKILYNNGTGSNMFFGEIGTDIYGFTNNLYSDIPALAMNVSSKKVTINGNAPTGMLTVQARADGNMFSIRGSIAGYSYPNIVEMGQSGADGYINVKDGAGNVQSVISGYGGTATYFLSKLGVGIASPNARLEVTSNTSGNGEVQRWSYNTGDANYSLRLKQEVTSGLVKHIFDLVNASTTYSNNLVLDRGNVGIGTSSPSYKLDVDGKSRINGANGSLEITGSGYIVNTSGMLLGQYVSGMGYIQAPSSGRIEIWNGGTENIATFNNDKTTRFYGGIIGTTAYFTGQITSDYRLGLPGMTIGYWDSANNRIESGSRPLLITSYGYALNMGINGATNFSIANDGTSSVNGFFTASAGLRVYNTLTFAGGDRNLECSSSGGVSIYSNEINSGAQGVTGDLYLGWRRTNYVNVGPPMVLSSTLTASGIIYANGGINMGSNAVKMRWGNNNTPTLALPFGDFGTALHIEVSDNDTGGLVISNDGTTVYGAGDQGFVFRVIDEDSYQGGGTVEANTCFKVNQGAGGGGYIKGDFTMTGSAYANAFYESSDSRLKDLIEHDVQVKNIENLKAKLYIKNGREEYGYFAQEAQSYMPSAVTKNSDGYLNLSYREVHTVKIARLEKRVAELEKQLNVA